jgi:hypothetical protein
MSAFFYHFMIFIGLRIILLLLNYLFHWVLRTDGITHDRAQSGVATMISDDPGLQ